MPFQDPAGRGGGPLLRTAGLKADRTDRAGQAVIVVRFKDRRRAGDPRAQAGGCHAAA